MWSISFLISFMFNTVPIITDLRQARDANIERTLEGLQSVFGAS